MECWSLVLSKANGEGVFGMADQFSFRIRLHLGARWRSHSDVDLIPRLSFAQCSRFVETKSAKRYVRAARSGCESV
jgi:hypothetical protein